MLGSHRGSSEKDTYFPVISNFFKKFKNFGAQDVA